MANDILYIHLAIKLYKKCPAARATKMSASVRASSPWGQCARLQYTLLYITIYNIYIYIYMCIYICTVIHMYIIYIYIHMMYVNIIPRSGEFSSAELPKARRFLRWSAQRNAWDCGSAQTVATAHRNKNRWKMVGKWLDFASGKLLHH